MGKVLFDIERVRSILDAEDIDVLLTCRPENFSYISGVTRPLESGLVREVPGYALLTRDGNAAVIIPWYRAHDGPGGDLGHGHCPVSAIQRVVH